jgi:hypothetical protein
MFWAGVQAREFLELTSDHLNRKNTVNNEFIRQNLAGPWLANLVCRRFQYRTQLTAPKNSLDSAGAQTQIFSRTVWHDRCLTSVSKEFGNA